MPAIESRVTEFTNSLESDAASYGVKISSNDLDRFAAYYTLLEEWNPRLHLVAPCSPRNFARQHVLESLLLLPYLPRDARVIDIGSGAGLPIVPCLIARSDIRATLVESSKKKAIFLLEALKRVETKATVVADRFQNVDAANADAITCRALERFSTVLPTMIEWAPSGSKLLLFAGRAIRDRIEELGLNYKQINIANSAGRFLLVVQPN